MYDRIVVPVDGSPFAEEVIPYALGIAQATGAKLTLLRIAEKDSKSAEAESDAYVQTLAAKFLVEGRSVFGRDDVSASILREADRIPGTLVAITSHGRGGVFTAMLGSVAREIVHASHKPVLVWRPDGKEDSARPTRITTVLLPLDGTSLSESMGPEAVEWAHALQAGLTIVQVLPANARFDSLLSAYDVLDSSYVSSRASDLKQRFGIEADWEVLYGDPAESIARYLDGRRDVVAVMATRTRSALKAAVLGSVTSEMVHKAGIPIIVQAPIMSRRDTAAATHVSHHNGAAVG
ncbi:MAG: universal stress protein [Terrimesophilobacter sp.]